MKSVCLAASLTAVCYFAVSAQHTSETTTKPPRSDGGEARSIESQQPIGGVQRFEPAHAEQLAENARKAVESRADGDARRREIIQNRATAAAERRRARMIAAENQPRQNVWATSAGTPRPVVYWDSPNWRPRDVDVLVFPESE